LIEEINPLQQADGLRGMRLLMVQCLSVEGSTRENGPAEGDGPTVHPSGHFPVFVIKIPHENP
jgi:hypothetical protein